MQDTIPYKPVNTTIHISDPFYNSLGYVGNWIYLNNVGINGIIIYRKSLNGSGDFVALERTSSYLPDNPYALAKVQSDKSLKDTISGSKWQIFDGSVISGPATLPLRQYTTFYDNSTELLTIKN